jgi:hypothetical protein
MIACFCDAGRLRQSSALHPEVEPLEQFVHQFPKLYDFQFGSRLMTPSAPGLLHAVTQQRHTECSNRTESNSTVVLTAQLSDSFHILHHRQRLVSSLSGIIAHVARWVYLLDFHLTQALM